MALKNITSLAFLVLLLSCKESDIPSDTHVLTASYGTRYRLDIHLPEGYDSGKPGGYPLLLYTDAAYMKSDVRKALKSKDLENKLIAVGIGYEEKNRRTEDLSPTATALSGTGNADAFAGFIEEEVLEYLRTRYAVSNTPEALTFCGHSLGGLFGTYLFLKKPGLFSGYLLISPSLMWDEQAIFEIESAARLQSAVPEARVFIAAGSLETGGFHTTRRHLTGLFEKYYPNVNWQEKVYRNKDHSGVVAPAASEGLAYIYRR